MDTLQRTSGWLKTQGLVEVTGSPVFTDKKIFVRKYFLLFLVKQIYLRVCKISFLSLKN